MNAALPLLANSYSHLSQFTKFRLYAHSFFLFFISLLTFLQPMTWNKCVKEKKELWPRGSVIRLVPPRGTRNRTIMHYKSFSSEHVERENEKRCAKGSRINRNIDKKIFMPRGALHSFLSLFLFHSPLKPFNTYSHSLKLYTPKYTRAAHDLCGC